MSVIIDKGTLQRVLDHGYIRIIDFMGKDESIVEAARMSTDKGFISWEPYSRCDTCGEVQAGVEPYDTQRVTSTLCAKHKMVKYPAGDLGMLDNLWRKKHATPFEMGELVIEVYAPIFVFREWHRHRTQSYNEFSARYSVMPDVHYLPDLARIQKQSTANKQGSAESMPEEYAKEVLGQLEEQQHDIYSAYDAFVTDGVAKEVARINTPVSRYSKMRAKGNIRNWFQFLNLRMRPDAQYEIRQYALAVGTIINWLWPKAYALFEEYDLYGVHFSRTEMNVIRKMFEAQKLHLGASATASVMSLAENEKLTGTKAKEFLEKLEYGGIKILS